MTVLDIVTYPDDFLAKPTVPVVVVDDALKNFICDMADTMYEAPGVGLAANQVGSDKRMLIYDADADPEVRNYTVLINPEITSSEGQFVSENEGCLSVPEFRSDVKRFASVVVEALDIDLNPIRIEASGMEAVILQHEIDHLNGVLFIDHISSLKRQMYKRRVKKIMKGA